MRSILIATSNKHKVEEIKSILGSAFDFMTLGELPNAPKPIEDAPDFAGNATKKAVRLAEWVAEIGLAARIDHVLADDSGLEVDALGGAPGVHSARFAALDSGAAGNSADGENNAKLLRLLTGVSVEKRSARFRCVIAFATVPEEVGEVSSPVCLAPESELGIQLFEGACEGRIVEGPRGAQGFGYDPLFVPDGFRETFAELGEAQKNEISHRAKALAKLRSYLDRLAKGRSERQ